MIMAHARAPALVTRAMPRELPCDLLICQCSALRFAQGNFYAYEAADSRFSILGSTECLSLWQHVYAPRDHALLRGHVLVRSAIHQIHQVD